MIKKGIDDPLLLAHKFLALFEPVGFALDVHDGAVVQDAVENGGGNGNVGKTLFHWEKVLLEVKTVEVLS